MNSNFNDLISSNTPVLVDFSAEWCGPCKMMTPVLEQLKSSMGEKIKILKVDVDANREIAFKYTIRSVPTLILFHEGKKVWSGVGVMSADNLEQIIKRNLNVLINQ